MSKTTPSRRAYLLARRQNAIEKGLCITCGIRPCRDSTRTCVVCQEIRQRSQFKRAYGITPQEKEAKRLGQDNKCTICQKEFQSTPHVDHSEITRRVRSLLCGKCNTMIGLAEENIEIL